MVRARMGAGGAVVATRLLPASPRPWADAHVGQADRPLTAPLCQVRTLYLMRIVLLQGWQW